MHTSSRRCVSCPGFETAVPPYILGSCDLTTFLSNIQQFVYHAFLSPELLAQVFKVLLVQRNERHSALYYWVGMNKLDFRYCCREWENMACLERKTWMFLVCWETGKTGKLSSSTQGRFLSEGCSLEVFSALESSIQEEMVRRSLFKYERSFGNLMV